jgi:hypothetical protein
LPAICGKATLATEESSTTMKVASITAAAIVHGFAAGFHLLSSVSAFCRELLSALIRRSNSAA